MTSKTRSSRLSWTVVAVVSVTVLLVAIGLLMTRPGGLRGVLVRTFGPPQVEMTEAHSQDAGTSSFDHAPFDALLATHVDEDGLVDYPGLAERRGELQAYIDSLAEAPFAELGRDEKLALLINAYNAFTLELILDHDPSESIRDIPAAERWKAERWNVGGELYSLDQIEHEQIRPMFREPRIHFALVCAAVGCPPLRREAYVAERLEAQLEDQTVLVHGNERWVRYTPGAARIELTALYEWFRGDFDQVAGSILEFVARYRNDLAAELEAGRRPRVSFLHYDWGLNRQGG